MTEILINELSLNGQFNSVNEFIDGALIKFNVLLNEIKGPNVLLYKNYLFYESRITGDITIHNILVGAISRQYDEIRKMKSSLACLFEEPFWESNQKHSSDIRYMFMGNCVTGQSLAEACERDRIVISFIHPDFSSGSLFILKGTTRKTGITLDNLINGTDYIEMAYNKSIINCEEYCKKKFKGDKLDFSKIDPKNGFNLLSKDDENLFIDGFRKFTELTWVQINKDGALRLKEYKDNEEYFKPLNKKIHKFRISEKYRCFGYIEQGIFYVLLFDLTHKLSDEG
jgi:hypothetical protein